METIYNSDNATQMLETINANQGSGSGIQEVLLTDNATDLVEKLNENFEALAAGGSGVFPQGTILPMAIGSFAQGEDIGGVTMEDFITYGLGNGTRKFTFLHASDLHNVVTTVNDASERMANDSSISCLILSGDMDALSSETPISGSSYYTFNNALLGVKDAGKLIVCVGNHDAGLNKGSFNGTQTKTQMSPWVGNYMQWDDRDEGVGCYWYKDYNLGKGKVRVICVDQYEYPADYSQSYIVNIHAQDDYVSQAQVDWFVYCLRDLGEDDYFIVVLHEIPYFSPDSPKGQNRRRENKFCSSRIGRWGVYSLDGTFFPAIVNAYTHKTSVQKVHNTRQLQSGSVVTVQTAAVNEDFSDVEGTPAKFLCYLCGHLHADWVGYHNLYPDQLIMMIDSGKATADLPSDIRLTDTENTRASAIMYNKVTVDVVKRTIKIDRCGQQQTCEHIVGTAGTTTADTDDPHGDGYSYPAILRDTITFPMDVDLEEES